MKNDQNYCYCLYYVFSVWNDIKQWEFWYCPSCGTMHEHAPDEDTKVPIL